MKLYQTAGENGDVHARWAGSQADASKQRVALKKEGYRNVQTAEHDVPTDKAGLLGWLNENGVVV
ncbi:hypothetical protein [Herminiimonas sp. CN]|uniref:hypothetical protein n=1 Tax=Herminiimonas sp. CN TaxID=1349818 RepID=UPI00047366EC|nr:hypothetical protein [Herminiimonas sp. CN]